MTITRTLLSRRGGISDRLSRLYSVDAMKTNFLGKNYIDAVVEFKDAVMKREKLEKNDYYIALSSMKRSMFYYYDIPSVWRKMIDDKVNPDVRMMGIFLEHYARVKNFENMAAFELMLNSQRDKYDEYSYSALIYSMARRGDASKTIKLYEEYLQRKFEPKPEVLALIIEALSEVKLGKETMKLIHECKDLNIRDRTSIVNAKIRAFVNLDYREDLDFYLKVVKRTKGNINNITLLSLIKFYSLLMNKQKTLAVYEKLKKNCDGKLEKLNLFSLNKLVTSFVHLGQFEESIKIYEVIENHFQPNVHTFVSLIPLFINKPDLMSSWYERLRGQYKDNLALPKKTVYIVASTFLKQGSLEFIGRAEEVVVEYLKTSGNKIPMSIALHFKLAYNEINMPDAPQLVFINEHTENDQIEQNCLKSIMIKNAEYGDFVYLEKFYKYFQRLGYELLTAQFCDIIKTLRLKQCWDEMAILYDNVDETKLDIDLIYLNNKLEYYANINPPNIIKLDETFKELLNKNITPNRFTINALLRGYANDPERIQKVFNHINIYNIKLIFNDIDLIKSLCEKHNLTFDQLNSNTKITS
ncbi:hypothetical protein ROZALSC1DRAFT_29161 [Rozella allomycis CSF55]|uniref:Pentacotripeptide-repeat region of PRORP domain-containing protein n=1 Tax=Rozella allomycis (strain CSF55) TaxID=988480 RepID=A0A4P9YK34_ROZAC|nr:hypothetical protein ROZALSC1DRAFT_29161 [Rozella allomycis CSF55]